MADKKSIGRRWEAYQPTKTLWFWSCVGCAIATMVIGFGWGGWVTGGTAAKMSAEAALNGRAQLVASFCVGQFEKAPDAAAQLALLKKTDNIWERGKFIEKGGWATMPGEKAPVDGAAALCAKDLMAEAPKPPGTSG